MINELVHNLPSLCFYLVWCFALNFFSFRSFLFSLGGQIIVSLFLVGLVLFHKQHRKISLDRGHVRCGGCEFLPPALRTKYCKVPLCEQALTAMHAIICRHPGAKPSLQRRLMSFSKRSRPDLKVPPAVTIAAAVPQSIRQELQFPCLRYSYLVVRMLHASGPNPCFSKCRLAMAQRSFFPAITDGSRSKRISSRRCRTVSTLS